MFDYDLEISVDGVPTSSLSKRMGLGSNGEHLCPFHVIVAVALKHAYRLEPEKRAGGLCLMMLDEAFNAMDVQHALSAATFISDLGDRKRVVKGTSMSVSVVPGGRRIMKK